MESKNIEKFKYSFESVQYNKNVATQKRNNIKKVNLYRGNSKKKNDISCIRESK